jgi:GPH family glycoside/pentoside/hexuronide:cation symporter
MTWGGRVAFACGQLGLMVTVRFFFSWNLRFADGRSASGEILLDAAWVGLAFFAARLFDGVTDPIAGWLSDRWVGRGGERRTLLWYSFLVPLIGLIMIFMPNHDMSVGVRWFLTLGGMFLFFVGYTFYAIPYWSLTDDYSHDDKRERRTLSTLLGASLILATAVVGVLSPLLVDAFGYLPAGIALAVPSAALMILPFWGQPRRGARAQTRKLRRESLFRQITAALRHRLFLAVLIIFSGSQMAFTVITASAPFIATALLGGTEKDVSLILGSFLATAIPSFLFAPALSRRFGWQRVVALSSLLLAVAYGGAAGLGEAWLGTPMHTAMAVFALAGPMSAVILALEAEAITECARHTGLEVTSLYFGMFNFMIKALNGLAFFLTGILVAMVPEIGSTAVRGMPFLAGALLALGVAGYAIARPRGVASPAD